MRVAKQIMQLYYAFEIGKFNKQQAPDVEINPRWPAWRWMGKGESCVSGKRTQLKLVRAGWAV